jgi:hypothetical protein
VLLVCVCVCYHLHTHALPLHSCALTQPSNVGGVNEAGNGVGAQRGQHLQTAQVGFWQCAQGAVVSAGVRGGSMPGGERVLRLTGSAMLRMSVVSGSSSHAPCGCGCFSFACGGCLRCLLSATPSAASFGAGSPPWLAGMAAGTGAC